MTDKIETGAGASADAAGMIKQFVSDFRAHQDRVETKLRAQDEKIALTDRKAAVGRRPTLAAEPVEAPLRKALAAYVRHGEEIALEGVEHKALVTTDDTQGGILVDARANENVASIKRAAGTLRAVANIVQVESGAYETLVDHANLGTAWVTEADTVAETPASAIERISIPLHELAAMPKASQRLLEDSAFDVERWLTDSASDTFARAEGAAFISGAGTNSPRGLLSYPTAAASAAGAGTLGYVATGVAGDFNATDPSNDIVDLVYSLGARYRANGAFVMNSATAGAIRKMKDAEGRFMWAERMNDSEPSRLLGYPVIGCEDMPDIAADSFSVAFGDFRAGYTIAERRELRILRDPYSAKPHVQFYVSTRVGGAVVDFGAIRLLKFGVS